MRFQTTSVQCALTICIGFISRAQSIPAGALSAVSTANDPLIAQIPPLNDSSALADLDLKNSTSLGFTYNNTVGNLSTQTPFPPFSEGGFDFSGVIDERLLPGPNIATTLSRAQNARLNAPRQTIRVQPGRQIVYHDGFGGEIEVSFLLLMEGGAALTYAAVNQAIDAVKQHLGDLDELIEVTISQNGSRKIILSIRRSEGSLQVYIQHPNTLQLEGMAWPARRMPQQPAQLVIQDIQSTIAQQGSQAGGLNMFVPQDYRLEANRQYAKLSLTFENQDLASHPVTFSDVRGLLSLISSWFNVRGSYCEMYGGLLSYRYAEYGQSSLVGKFRLEYSAPYIATDSGNAVNDTLIASNSSLTASPSTFATS